MASDDECEMALINAACRYYEGSVWNLWRTRNMEEYWYWWHRNFIALDIGMNGVQTVTRGITL